MGTISLATGLLLVLLEGVRAEFCANSYMYCEDGCCGNTCCADHIPVIVGSTVGGVVFIVILIVSVCVYKKKGNKAAVGVDPNMLATTALAAQQFGFSPQMVQPFGNSASPQLPLHYGMQPVLNPLLSYPLSANLPSPYLLPANQLPSNPAPANPAVANLTPANQPSPANPAAANHPPPNPPPDKPAPTNPPPQQAPSPT